MKWRKKSSARNKEWQWGEYLWGEVGIGCSINDSDYGDGKTDREKRVRGINKMASFSVNNIFS